MRVENVKTHRPPATTGPVMPRLFVRPRPRNALQIRSGLAAGELEKALRRETRARQRQFLARLYLTFFTRSGLRRLFHYVAGSLLVIPLLHWLLTPLHVKDMEISLVVAATFGVVMALFRPRGITVGFLLAATAFTTLAFAGFVGDLDDALNVLLALLVHFGFGLALGITENIVRQGE